MTNMSNMNNTNNMNNAKSIRVLLTEAFNCYHVDGSFADLARVSEDLLQRLIAERGDNKPEDTYIVRSVKEILNKLQLEGVRDQHSTAVDVAVSVCFQYLTEQDIPSVKNNFSDRMTCILYVINFLNGIPTEKRNKKFRDICEQLCSACFYMLSHEKIHPPASEALRAAETNDED